jgi:hypothetical protein
LANYENGDRKSRALTVDELKSNTVKLPVSNSKSLNLTENLKTQVPEEGEINTLVYPNPNKGLIKIYIHHKTLLQSYYLNDQI